MRFKYCIISEIMGSFVSAFTTLRSIFLKNCLKLFIIRMEWYFSSIYFFIQNIIGFAILASVTVGIMLLMDTMECFLHTLRLHWVEFQNKFYKGDGFSFKNYNFQSEINEYLRKNSLWNLYKFSFFVYILFLFYFCVTKFKDEINYLKIMNSKENWPNIFFKANV